MNWIQRHWPKLLLGGGGGIFVLAVVSIAALPTLIGYGPVRNFLLHRLFDGKEVRVAVDAISVGWFRSTEVKNLSVQQNEQKFQVRVPRIFNDVTLWQLLWRPRQLGNLVIASPTITVQLPSKGADLFDADSSTASSLDNAEVQQALRHAISVTVTDATVEVHRPGLAQPWGFAGIQFIGQLRPGATPEEGPTVLVPQATLMDHQRLTQEMCDDLLKFVAPVVTGVAKIEGETSLELRDIRVSLARRDQSVGQGTLHIHNARLTGTPLVRTITDFLGLGASAEVASDCRITFRLADQQIWHEGLDFGIGDLRIQTSGYVGLDESLDLIAVVLIPESLADRADAPRPWLDALRGKRVEIPIVGTLDEPRIDTERLARSLVTTAESAVREWLGNDGLRLDLGGEDGALDLSQIRGLAESLLEGAQREGDLFDRVRERREEPEAGAPGARGLRRLLQRNRDVPQEAPPPPPGSLDL